MQDLRLERQESRTPASAFSSCVTLGKFIDTKAQFPDLQNKGRNT